MSRTIPLLLCCATLACTDSGNPVAPGSRAVTSPLTSQAGAPQPVDIDEVLPSTCAFPLRLQITGNEKFMVRPNGTLFVSAPGERLTVTNLTNGKSASHTLTGSISVVFQENGDAELTFRGLNLVETAEGLFFVVGNWTATFDEAGNDVEPLRGKGQRIDVCALLS